MLPELRANAVRVLQNTEEHHTTHCHPASRAPLQQKSAHLRVVVNVHYIDRSVAVTHEKKSVLFRLQDLQKVNVGATINKNKIFELQTNEKEKKRKECFLLRLAGNSED